MKFLTFVAASLALGLASSALAQGQAPMADPSPAANPAMKSPSDMGSAPLAKGHNSFTMGQAKGRIEKAGYTAVSGLTRWTLMASGRVRRRRTARASAWRSTTKATSPLSNKAEPVTSPGVPGERICHD